MLTPAELKRLATHKAKLKWTEAKIDMAMRDYLGGMSQTDAATKHGMPYSVFRYHLKRLRTEGAK